MSYDLQPNHDGDGAVVRITNTGRTTIPATSPHVDVRVTRPRARVARSFVTVTASATDPANPDPVLLITSPLVADLLPGATVSLDVPAIEALTGMTTNWLSVDLVVLGEASWLGPYSSAGAWFSDAPSGHEAQRGRSNQPD